MDIKDFNVDNWEESCGLYDRNKAGLGFQASCYLQEGKLKIKLENIDAKYKDAVEKLILNNAQGAVIVMNDVVSTNYVLRKEDIIEERNKCNEITHNNMIPWLNILFQQGFNVFIDAITTQSLTMETSYLLNHLSNKNGVWTLPNGSQWNGSGWHQSDGSVCYDTYNIWRSILGDGLQAHPNPESESNQPEIKIA